MTGSGDVAFCGGSEGNFTNGIGRRRQRKKPVIAVVQGYAYGKGMELALMCDLIICTERALFAFSQVKKGEMPSTEALTRLYQTVGHLRFMAICLTGKLITAREAKEQGWVNEVVAGKKEALKTALVYAKWMSNTSSSIIAGIISSSKL